MQLSTLASRISVVFFAAAGLVACQTAPSYAPSSPSVPGAAAPRPQAMFIRPAAGPTIARYDGNRSKGIDIAGHLGDPVLAARDGRVAIVTSALRPYGTMIIIKHNETYITSYAHISRALVKENDVVRQGQEIAEMGQTGASRVMLHFEIRRYGVAVNPEPYLDGRIRN